MIVLYDSVIRFGELLGLKVSDVNLQKSILYLRIRGKGDWERIVSIFDNAENHLRNYMDFYHGPDLNILEARNRESGNLEMGVPVLARNTHKYVRIIKTAHSDLPKRVHPHMSRRTRATDLYRATSSWKLSQGYLATHRPKRQGSTRNHRLRC